VDTVKVRIPRFRLGKFLLLQTLLDVDGVERVWFLPTDYGWACGSCRPYLGGVGLHVSEYVAQTSIHRTGSPYSYPSHVNTILEGSAGHETPDKHSVGILVVGVLESVLGLV